MGVPMIVVVVVVVTMIVPSMMMMLVPVPVIMMIVTAALLLFDQIYAGSMSVPVAMTFLMVMFMTAPWAMHVPLCGGFAVGQGSFMLMLVLVAMAVIVPASRSVTVLMFMTAPGSMHVGMRMRMGVLMFMTVIMIMPATALRITVLGAAIRLLGLGRDQVEQRQDHQANPGNQDHGAEDPVRRKVVHQTPADIEVEHHCAPQHQEQNADHMNGNAFRHGLASVEGEGVTAGATAAGEAIGAAGDA